MLQMTLMICTRQMRNVIIIIIIINVIIISVDIHKKVHEELVAESTEKLDKAESQV